MTNYGLREIICNRIKSYRYRSAWARGVCMYALDLATNFDFDAIGEKPIRDIMLNGSREWHEL